MAEEERPRFSRPPKARSAAHEKVSTSPERPRHASSSPHRERGIELKEWAAAHEERAQAPAHRERVQRSHTDRRADATTISISEASPAPNPSAEAADPVIAAPATVLPPSSRWYTPSSDRRLASDQRILLLIIAIALSFGGFVVSLVWSIANYASGRVDCFWSESSGEWDDCRTPGAKFRFWPAFGVALNGALLLILTLRVCLRRSQNAGDESVPVCCSALILGLSAIGVTVCVCAAARWLRCCSLAIPGYIFGCCCDCNCLSDCADCCVYEFPRTDYSDCSCSDESDEAHAPPACLPQYWQYGIGMCTACAASGALLWEGCASTRPAPVRAV